MQRLFRILTFISMALLQTHCAQVHKINGISFVGPPKPMNSSDIAPMLATNASWGCVMPFGYQRGLHNSNLIYDTPWQWWGESLEGATKTIRLMKAEGLLIMLKPQIWVIPGEFTGYIDMQSEAAWVAYEKKYEEFIMTYAQVAQAEGVDLFCIGTELNGFVVDRPEFWNELIVKIRKVYKGNLTYAENWDVYQKVPFWEQLDYIGIDAYFPLSEQQTPTIEMLRKGWQHHKEAIKQYSLEKDKQILFTEYGYRSVDYTAKEPWNYENKGAVNLTAQSNALEALYQELWDEEWFAGGFLWKWFKNHEQSGGDDSSAFTPQNKPATQIIRKQYNKN